MNSSRVKLQHRPFLTPIWVTAGAAAAAFLFALFLIWVWGTAGSSTVIVIPADPEAGGQRAAAVARMFGAGGPGRVDAVLVSDLPRNRAMVAPLAAQLHITPGEAPDDDPKAIARLALHARNAGRVLVVAAPDVFPGVVQALCGGADIPPVTGAEYGVVYVVTVPRFGHANLLRLTY